MNRLPSLAVWTVIASGWAGIGCAPEPVGRVLVYEFDATSGEDRTVLSEQLVTVLNQRLTRSGRARAVEGSRIEVDLYGLPEDDEVQRIDRLLVRPGDLEFAILANRRDHVEIVERADALSASEGQSDLYRGGRLEAGWRPVAVDARGRPKLAEDDAHGEVVVRQVNGRQERLVIFEPQERRVTGEFLARAHAIRDERGNPAIGFRFTERGGRLFHRLTIDNRPSLDGFQRRVAVLLDGEIHSAPSLLQPISTEGRITGRFTAEEAQEIAAVLRTGRLPYPIRKVEERKVE